MSNSDRPEAEHLDVDDGCGCTELWEHTSEHRDTDADASTDE